MDNQVFYNINKIIERDSKTTTYKYALLRGVIDIIQDNSPYIEIIDNRAHIPLGLLIEKWLIYYYPILQSQALIPQINGNTQLAFSNQLKKLIGEYEKPGRGGFSAFYNDLKNRGIPAELQKDFYALAKKLQETIVRMPMKYIGRSISEDYYSIFTPDKSTVKRRSIMDLGTLISDFGKFSIPFAYYEAFSILGSFMSGQDAILFKWAEFSVEASPSLTMGKVLNEVLKSPVTAREVGESKKLYKGILQTQGTIYCVWTGKKIKTYDVDHVIPFSAWKNNDLWNLLPSDAKVNKLKRDKIPCPELVEKQKELILSYWEILFHTESQRFQKEIQVALLGNQAFTSWKNRGISQLQNSCNYLIDKRGFEGWQI